MLELITLSTWQKEEEIALEELIGNESKIVVYNDDYNTFDWVIQSFIEICRHNAAQAEQLSYIIHFKGKATVKTGSKKELKPIKDALIDRGLSAVIEDWSLRYFSEARKRVVPQGATRFLALWEQLLGFGELLYFLTHSFELSQNTCLAIF